MIVRLFDKLLLTLEDSNLAFQEEKLQLFVALLHLHLLIQYSLKPGGLPYSLHLATSLLLLAAFLLCLKPAYNRLGIFLSTASLSIDLPPRTSPPSKLDPGPFEVHCTG